MPGFWRANKGNVPVGECKFGLGYLGGGYRDRSIRAGGRLRKQQLQFDRLAAGGDVEFCSGDDDV
jgi:hypothetical protein